MRDGMRDHRSGLSGVARATSVWRQLARVAMLVAATGLVACAHRARVDTPPPWLARHPNTDLRVLVWNVDREFLNRNQGFQRVVKAVDADLLILDEMPTGLSAEQVAGGLPPGGSPWRSLYGSGGGANQRATVSVRAPLQRVVEFDQLPYPRARFDEWMAEVPQRKRARVRDSLDAGVAAVGGVVEWHGRRVLVVGLDLECCGDSNNSPAEHRRRFEAQAIRAALDAVVERLKVDAVLVGGDFNTVHGEVPVAILQRGANAQFFLDYPTPRHRGADAADWTWDGRETPFPSRRIDYLLHSNALRVLQSQVFDSEDLAPGQQQTLQLEAALSKSLSPHRPIVVDFAWREQTN